MDVYRCPSVCMLSSRLITLPSLHGLTPEASLFLKVCKMAFQHYIRYSSRLSLHSCVPFTRVFINFIRAISRRSRVTDSPHASHTLCAAATHESYFVQCTRVIHRVLHTSQTWVAARESVLVRYTRVIVCSYVYYVRITPN